MYNGQLKLKCHPTHLPRLSRTLHSSWSARLYNSIPACRIDFEGRDA